MVTFSLLKISIPLPTNQRKMVEFNFEFHLKDFEPNMCVLQRFVLSKDLNFHLLMQYCYGVFAEKYCMRDK